MAKYTVKHICGCNKEHQIFGKVDNRQPKADWMAQFECFDCQRKNAAENGKKIGLIGSDKQIAWAFSLRQDLSNEITKQLNELLKRCENEKDQTKQHIVELIEDCEKALTVLEENLPNDSKYYIDNRYNFMAETKKYLTKNLRAYQAGLLK